MTVHLDDYKPHPYSIPHVNLNFTIHSHEKVTVKSEFKLIPNKASTEQNQDLVFQVGDNVEINSIKIDDKELTDYQINEDDLTIPASYLTGISAENSLNFEIHNTINPQTNKTLEGLYKSNDILVTQCESEGFRRITPFIDRPDSLTDFTVTITADRDKFPVIISNGNKIADENLPDNLHTKTYRDPFPKPGYLFALVAGRFDLVEDTFTTRSGRPVTLQLYSEPGDKKRSYHGIESLKKAMKWDEDRFDLEYDLDLYCIVSANDFNSGAMENKGLNIFNSSCILVDPESGTDGDYHSVEAVVGHEYSHNWTGNRVTCRDWFQITLKEGLTNYREREFSSDMNSRLIQRISDVRYIKERQFMEDAGPNCHPIRPRQYEAIDNFYTSTIYYKGAEVIGMIHTLIGEENFKNGISLYIKRHDGQAVTTDEFVQAMQDTSGLDLTQFKNTWYEQAGTPKLAITENLDLQSLTYTLNIEQILAFKDHKPYHMPFLVGLIDQNGNEIKLELANNSEQKDLDRGLLHLRELKESFTFKLPTGTTKVVPSLLRDFCAPVILQYQHNEPNLIHLMKYDTNEFNRYQASQEIATIAINKIIDNLERDQKSEIDDTTLEIYGGFFDFSPDQTELIAQMLILPPIRTIAQHRATHDYPKIKSARDYMLKAIAQKYEKQILETYLNQNPAKPYRYTAEDSAQRSLKGVLLNYLAKLDDKYFHLIKEQYYNSDNMTEQFQALRLAVDFSQGQEIKEHFLDRWKSDQLVFNKYLVAISYSEKEDTLNEVLKAEQHPSFNIENPNNVYSLYSAFAGNVGVFHLNAQENYRFYVDRLAKIDKFNSKLATNIAKQLDIINKLPEQNRNILKTEISRITTDQNLSKILLEVLNPLLKV
ncbi:aminopeptidase N [Candidatus Peregrinibacteria bacterium HGW-Peregrinibacteria-1]|jgi:aminopeptidase N|nr:MAG: aminopeptidase N [Candidatus Peregrinibacteria bacterium HGW-Peregrinibacteria-1]